jgi:hypothetical protein
VESLHDAVFDIVWVFPKSLLYFEIIEVFLSGCFLPFAHCFWFRFLFDTIDFEPKTQSSFEHFDCSFVSRGELGFVKEPIEGGNVCVEISMGHGQFFEFGQGSFL